MRDPDFVSIDDYNDLKERLEAYRLEVKGTLKTKDGIIETLEAQLKNAKREISRWQEKATNLAEILTDGYEKAQEIGEL